MADDKVIYALHRAIRVRPDFDRAAVTATKGYGYRTRMGDAMDSPTAFVVREAADVEVEESMRKLKDDVDARVEHLQMEAKIAARVVQLRTEAKIAARVEELRQHANRVDG